VCPSAQDSATSHVTTTHQCASAPGSTHGTTPAATNSAREIVTVHRNSRLRIAKRSMSSAPGSCMSPQMAGSAANTPNAHSGVFSVRRNSCITAPLATYIHAAPNTHATVTSRRSRRRRCLRSHKGSAAVGSGRRTITGTSSNRRGRAAAGRCAG